MKEREAGACDSVATVEEGGRERRDLVGSTSLPDASSEGGLTVLELTWRGVDHLVISWPSPSPSVGGGRLSAAEADVARLVVEGLSNAEIAVMRGKTERTIANQVASVLRKLNVPSRHHVARALANGASAEWTTGRPSDS